MRGVGGDKTSTLEQKDLIVSLFSGHNLLKRCRFTILKVVGADAINTTAIFVLRGKKELFITNICCFVEGVLGLEQTITWAYALY